MKSIKYFASAYLLAGAMSMQAMDKKYPFLAARFQEQEVQKQNQLASFTQSFCQEVENEVTNAFNTDMKNIESAAISGARMKGVMVYRPSQSKKLPGMAGNPGQIVMSRGLIAIFNKTSHPAHRFYPEHLRRDFTATLITELQMVRNLNDVSIKLRDYNSLNDLVKTACNKLESDTTIAPVFIKAAIDAVYAKGIESFIQTATNNYRKDRQENIDKGLIGQYCVQERTTNPYDGAWD